MFRISGKQWFNDFVLQMTVLNDREFSIAKQKSNSIQELARRKHLVYTGNRNLICWKKCLKFFWLAWIRKKILHCFGPVKTPAKHVLLVNISLSPRLNIHQGLKIGCICSTHQHLKMPNCEHWTLIAELAQHSALVIGKIHSSSLVDALKPHAHFQYSPVLKIDSIFKTHVR